MTLGSIGRSSASRFVPAVVLGLSPTGLYVVRELGRSGVPVLGVSSYQQAGNYSRYIREGLGSIVEDDELRRLDRLVERFKNCSSQPFLIPTSDQDIDFILRHRAVLSEQFVFQDSYRDTVGEAVLTKAVFYALCREHGVEMPRFWCEPREQVESLKSEIEFPCFVKPSRIDVVKEAMSGKKGWVVRDVAQFEQVVRSLPAGDTKWVIQEIIPGPESEITLYAAYFDEGYRPHQAFTGRKLRQYPPGFGSASLVASNSEEETKEIAERLLAEIRYRGIAAVEFKRAPRDGRLKIIEVNPRPALWFGLSTAAGKRITLAAYLDLALGRLDLKEQIQLNGVGWRYGLKDGYSRLFYSLSPNFVLPPPQVRVCGEFSSRVSAIWSADDPWPAAGELVSVTKKAVRRCLGVGPKKMLRAAEVSTPPLSRHNGGS